MENGTTNGASSEFFNLKNMHHIVKALDRNQKVLDNILHDIGNTPLVKLSNIPKEEGIECDMYAKCEFLNPGGSIKDRIAFRMITDAEERGLLIPKKSVIIEPTSGNTGVGLALAAAVKGYRCVIVLPEKMSDEKVNTMKALGAEIIRTPTEAPSSSPESNIGVARRLVKEIPNGVLLDQYNNPNNPIAHYDGTAEEILWSLDDDIDMVVIGAGTGGTISGTAHKIKERNPNCVVVGVDPYGSILAEPDEINKTDITMYEVEGIGYDFFPKTIDRKIVDRWVKTDDFNSLNMARRLIQQEGLLCGGSSGAVMWGALQAARGLKSGQKCVVILPDNIRNYLTKFVSDQWMEARDLKVVDDNENLWWWNLPVPEEMPQQVTTVSNNSSPVEALALLYSTKATAVLAVDDKQVITGVFTADDARKRLANLSGSTTELLSKFLVKKFYKINLSKNPTIGKVSRMLDISPYVVVVNTDPIKKVEVPVGLITSGDLLHYVTKTK